jgi:GNAT superfamily N-acetyltransferase
VAELHPATGPRLHQILRESFPIWNDGLGFAEYVKFWEAQLRTPWGSAHLDRVAIVENGFVTSSAKRYDLSARIEGRLRRLLGIGAVFTSPERRRQGAARALLESMLDAAEAEGYDYALLFSEIDPAFYEQLDFVPVPLLESRVEVFRRDGAPAMLVRAGDDRDLPAIVEMSAARSQNARFSLDRSEDWIRFGLAKRRLLSGLGPTGLREVEFFVAEEGHQAVAYLISMIHRGCWFIEDAGDRDPAGARVGAMLQVMLARAPHLATPLIYGWLPHEFNPPQITRVESLPTKEVMMIRALGDRRLPVPSLDARDIVYWRSDYF